MHESSNTLLAKWVFICTFLLLSASATANNNVEEITWLQSDTAPFHLNKTSKAPNGGLCDYLIEQLIEQLPNIKHTRLLVPQKRIGKYLDEGKMACFPCMIHRTKSTDRVVYSIPTTVYPPFSIITTPAKAETISLQHGDPVQLIKLLTDSNFIFGQTAARKFTTEINEIARNTKSYDHASLSWSSENESSAVIARLNHGYIDYTIDYPFLADYYNRFSELSNVVALPIANQSNLVLGAIGCSTHAPNNFANNALRQINQVLQQNILPSAQYQASQRQWLEATFPDFIMQYQKQVLNVNPQATSAPAVVENPDKAEH
ncbi:ABC transporter substrate-binding protein [Pseudoalteromonas prydzensis]|uniref:ABC transporter substrate-binding protein n=1 Tax=Pseudoalteromonas prydzensis TaxID=182141 RepID=UPI0024BC3BED|nr:ABC transporter substrate-binding protein [Pseudoalteromonas prydzensis]